MLARYRAGGLVAWNSWMVAEAGANDSLAIGL